MIKLRRPRLPIAREGWPLIAACLGMAALAAPLDRRLALPPLAAALAAALFYRDPERPAPPRPNLLYAPADGRVLHVTSLDDAPELQGAPAWRVAVFLSLLDVHITRSPTAGVVRSVEHRPGRFQSAWDAGIEQTNERNTIQIATGRGPLAVVQIAGLVARRIVCYPRAGSAVGGGERIGLIRFGSRTDLIFPQAMAWPLVTPGQRVRGGVTPLAVMLGDSR